MVSFTSCSKSIFKLLSCVYYIIFNTLTNWRAFVLVSLVVAFVVAVIDKTDVEAMLVFFIISIYCIYLEYINKS